MQHECIYVYIHVHTDSEIDMQGEQEQDIDGEITSRIGRVPCGSWDIYDGAVWLHLMQVAEQPLVGPARALFVHG